MKAHFTKYIWLFIDEFVYNFIKISYQIDKFQFKINHELVIRRVYFKSDILTSGQHYPDNALFFSFKKLVATTIRKYNFGRI